VLPNTVGRKIGEEGGGAALLEGDGTKIPLIQPSLTSLSGAHTITKTLANREKKKKEHKNEEGRDQKHPSTAKSLVCIRPNEHD